MLCCDFCIGRELNLKRKKTLHIYNFNFHLDYKFSDSYQNSDEKKTEKKRQKKEEEEEGKYN
jgi:hypothetical protein